MATVKNQRRFTGRVILAVGTMLSAGLVWQASYAAFTATTDNNGNAWRTGTVALANNLGSAMWTTTEFEWEPGQTEEKCITVSYSGATEITAPVALYVDGGITGDTAALGNGDVPAERFTVEIDAATVTDNDDVDVDCTGWGAVDASKTNVYGGSGQTLADLATANTAYGSALDTEDNWTPDGTTTEYRTYRFIISMPSAGSDALDNQMQNKTINANFQWEAKS